MSPKSKKTEAQKLKEAQDRINKRLEKALIKAEKEIRKKYAKEMKLVEKQFALQKGGYDNDILIDATLDIYIALIKKIYDIHFKHTNSQFDYDKDIDIDIDKFIIANCKPYNIYYFIPKVKEILFCLLTKFKLNFNNYRTNNIIYYYINNNILDKNKLTATLCILENQTLGIGVYSKIKHKEHIEKHGELNFTLEPVENYG